MNYLPAVKGIPRTPSFLQPWGYSRFDVELAEGRAGLAMAADWEGASENNQSYGDELLFNFIDRELF